MGHIVIISEGKLFREALADAISRELGIEVTAMESPEPLASMDETAVDALVSTMALDKRWAAKAVVYNPAAPRKMASILADLTQQMSHKAQMPVVLSELLSVDPKARKLVRADTGSTIELTEKEQALLLFIKSSGEAGREEILTKIWGVSPEADTHTLDTHLYRLRQKWRELADYDCILATDKGYRWYE